MTIEELITKEEKELTQLTLRHNEIVEYQERRLKGDNANPSFYHDDEELSELMDKMGEKLDFSRKTALVIVRLKRELK